ncbi:hypothetical protein BJX61DRAFT_506288 [Aspergillus egyptiacus]|nr:hypothetical protein BJX61DRAFT_506288 [Aspergillus egyptiacus]
MEDIQPTARWANRMLRPLTSIYHRLEKHHEIVTSVLISKAKERSDTALDAEQTRLAVNGATEASCSYSDHEEPNDPAWIPGKLDKRKIRHNYSSRGRGNGARKRSRLLIRSPEAPRTLPGAIEIATPLITGKIRGPLAEPSPSLRVQLFQNHLSDVDDGGSTKHRRASRANNSSFRPYQGSWKEILDQSGDPGLVDIAHLLDRILLKFLSNTRIPSANSKGRGARSLLSMTVRRLPEFISEEQRIQDESDEGCEVDMCDAYFTELETAYAPSGNGWQPLREAVRSQGIYLVSRMIQRQWITSAASCRLIEESLSQGESDAVEALLTKSLANVEAYPYPTAFDPPKPSGIRDDPVHTLGTYFLRSSASRSYVFAELTRLLMRGTLPPEWMVTTRWKGCVDCAIKSVAAEDRDYAAARQLIEAVILSAAGLSVSASKLNHSRLDRPVRPRETRATTTHTSIATRDQCPCPVPIQDALSNLIASLIIALCGMCLARSQAAEAAERLAGLKTRDMINNLAYTVQRAVGNKPVASETEEASLLPLRRGYVLLADCTLQCGKSITADIIYHAEAVSKRNIESFFRSLASRQELVRELAGLVSQVFRHSGNAHGRGPTRTPKDIRERVSQLTRLTSTTAVSLFLGKVAAEAAMELAEKSLDPDDHAWAVEIQEQAVSIQHDESLEQSPSSNQLCPSLYRWEDSIGEWVARTPAVKPRPRAAAARPPARRRGRPGIIACSTSSSSTSSTCSEKTVSSATSSAPSISRKRPFAETGSSPQPFKKIYQTRSVERVVSKASDWASMADRPSCKPSGSADAPVAARTRTGLRGSLSLQGGIGRQRDVLAGETKSAEPISRVEVVIINKSLPAPTDTEPKENIRPIRRSTRFSSVLPRPSYRFPQRRKSAPPPVTRRRTVIPCSQDDDSDDELSFL